MGTLELPRVTAEQLNELLDARFTQLAEEMKTETGAFQVTSFKAEPTYMSATMADMSTVPLVRGGKNVEYVLEDQPKVDEVKAAIEESMERLEGQPLSRVRMSTTFLTRMEDLGKSDDVGKISNVLWNRVLVKRPSFVQLRAVAKEMGWLVQFTESRKSWGLFSATDKEQEIAEKLGEWSWQYNLKLEFVRDSMDFGAEFPTFAGGDSSRLLFPGLKRKRQAA